MNNRTLPFIFLFLFSFCFAARGQVAHVVPSARSVAQTAVADDASWNAFHNPAKGTIHQEHTGRLRHSLCQRGGFVFPFRLLAVP